MATSRESKDLNLTLISVEQPFSYLVQRRVLTNQSKMLPFEATFLLVLEEPRFPPAFLGTHLHKVGSQNEIKVAEMSRMANNKNNCFE